MADERGWCCSGSVALAQVFFFGYKKSGMQQKRGDIVCVQKGTHGGREGERRKENKFCRTVRQTDQTQGQ